MKILILLLVVIPSFCFAQMPLEEINWHGFTYYGSQPSAKIDAMGAGAVSLGEDVFSNFYNPAGISLLKNVEINSSYSFNTNDKYKRIKSFYGGIGYEHNKYLKFGLSLYNNLTQEIYDLGMGHPDPSFNTTADISRSLYTLTIASEPFKDFHCGLNTSLLQWRYYTANPTTTILMDFGVNTKFEIPSKKEVQQSVSIAGSIYNFTSSQIDRKTEYSTTKVKIPVYFGAGLNYGIALSKSESTTDLKTFELTSHLEFQKVLSTEFHTAIRTGAELKLHEILIIRFGYYYEVIPENYFTNYHNSLSNFTYGAGIQLPIEKLTKNRVPLYIAIDYTYLHDPLFATTVPTGAQMFSTLGVKIRWNFNKKDAVH